MFRNENFKLGVISVLFSLSLLVVLPRIPVVVKNNFIQVDSYIGGYVVKLFGDKISLDLQDYKKGLDLGGGKRYLYSVGDSNITEENAHTVVDILQKRLRSFGYDNFRIGFSQQDFSEIFIDIPHYQDDSNILYLTQGSGSLVFKKLIYPEAWDKNEPNLFYSSPNLWEETGITESDVEDVVVTSQSSGTTQIEFILTASGRSKFRELVKDNVNKPISINLDGSEYPSAAPVVSEILAQSENVNPVIVGSLDKEQLEVIAAKIKSGVLQTSLGYIGTYEIPGSNINNLFYALLIALGILIFYLVIKYRTLGLIVDISLIFGTALLLAFYKVFSVIINTHSLLGTLTSLGMFIYGFGLFVSKTDVNKEVLDISVLESFSGSAKYIKNLVVLCFLVFSITYFVSANEVKYFSASLSLGSIALLVSYFFVLKSLIKVSSFKKGTKK